MPFTPFHVGPAALFLPVMKFRDWLVLLAATLLIDFEPFIVLFLNLNQPLHGISHSFLGALIFALLLGSAVSVLFRKKIKLKSALIAAIVGAFTHVFVDSFLYSDMAPFYPLAGNPLLGVFTSPQITAACAAFFVLGIIMYFLAKR